MAEVPMKQAPNLAGWVIATAVAVVAVGLTRVVWDWPWAAAFFVAALLFVAVGLILGLPGRELPPKQTPVAPANTLAPGAPMAAATPAPAAAPAPAPAPAPVAAPAAPLMAAPVAPGAQKKPEGLAAARGGVADDLKIINGIGPKLEALCHRLGFFHFDQVAAWTPSEIAWVDENLEGFRGRVTRDRWVPQAQAIVKLGPQEFLRRLDAGEAF